MLGNSSGGPPEKARGLWPDLVYVAFSVGFVAFVWFAYAPFKVDFDAAIDVDTSYRMVLGQQHSLGLKTGSDIVYTFGPLGFLMFNSLGRLEQSIAIYVLPCFVALLLHVGYMIARESKAPLALASFMVGMTLLLGLGFGEPLMLFAIPAGLALVILSASASSPSPWLRRVLVVLLAASSLTKFSYFVLNGLMILALAALEICDKRKIPRVAAEYAFVLLVLWVVCGQSLLSFGTFVRDSWLVASGYGALGAGGGSLELKTLPYVLISVCLLGLAAATLAYERCQWLERACVLGAWVVFVLLGVKIGYAVFSTAHFFHQSLRYLMLGAIVSIIASMLLPQSRRFRALGVSASMLALVALTMLPAAVGAEGERSWKMPGELLARLDSGWLNAKAWRASPLAAEQVKEAAYAQIRSHYAIPASVGPNDSIDIYPDEQAIVLASHARYSPRPSFQGISTLSSPLAERNERFLGSEVAPKYILFMPPTPRGALSTINDAPTWPALLAEYDATGERVGNHVLFKRSDKPAAIRRVLLAEIEGRVGQPQDLPTSEGLVWAELSLKPTALGRMALLFARLPQPVLVLDTPDGEKRGGLPMKLLGSGFLLSPVIETPDDLVAMDDPVQRDSLRRKAVRRIRVDANPSYLYSREYSLIIYRLNIQ